MSEPTVYVKVTHRSMEHNGKPMFVVVELMEATFNLLDAFEDADESDASPAERRAIIAVRGKFKVRAGAKYFADAGGKWPADQEVSMSDLEFKKVTPPATARRSTQQRGRRQ